MSWNWYNDYDYENVTKDFEKAYRSEISYDTGFRVDWTSDDPLGYKYAQRARASEPSLKDMVIMKKHNITVIIDLQPIIQNGREIYMSEDEIQGLGLNYEIRR